MRGMMAETHKESFTKMLVRLTIKHGYMNLEYSDGTSDSFYVDESLTLTLNIKDFDDKPNELSWMRKNILLLPG